MPSKSQYPKTGGGGETPGGTQVFQAGFEHSEDTAGWLVVTHTLGLFIDWMSGWLESRTL